MATDQPTTPNLGNLSNAAFMALPDWSVIAANVAGKDDTWASMDDCVVALLYRLIRENFAYINEAFACRVDTPLSLAAKAVTDSVHWRESDWPALDLTAAQLTGITPTPDLLWTCNGVDVDEISAIKLNAPSPGTVPVYAVVSAQGSTGAAPAYPFKFGLRNHADRYYYSDDTAIARQNAIAFQATFSLPEWPQDTANPIVLAKVADYTSAVDTGAGNRIGFEFGLGPAPVADPNSDPRDYCMYVRWYDSGDVEQRVIAVLPLSEFLVSAPIAITPGRRVTLGFHRYFTFSSESWACRFYVNGRDITGELDNMESPSIAASSDLRMHVGSAQLGLGYTGGPINNVAIWSSGDSSAVATAMLAMYLRGEGFQAAP